MTMVKNAPAKNGDVAPAAGSRMTTRTRSQKVQAGLKERGERLLANAKASQPSSCLTSEASPSKKRKLQDVMEAEKHKTTTRGQGLGAVKSTQKSSAGKTAADRKCSASKKSKNSGAQTESSLAPPKASQKPPKPASREESGEKRLRRFRKQAPQNYLQKLHRAESQRLIVLKRTRFDAEPFPKEEVEIVGSTGNVYTVTIGQIPSCTCPDHQKGNECKHKIYVLRHVLKASEHLQYQLAFLSSELKDVFTTAPPIPTDLASAESTDGKRKAIEGECPICYMDFDEQHNALVWCKAACGNNMHKSCFAQWVASQRGVGGATARVTCVYCRTPWQADGPSGDSKAVKEAGSIGADGYVNVAEQFGLSQRRDYSTYHPSWVRQQLGTGW